MGHTLTLYPDYYEVGLVDYFMWRASLKGWDIAGGLSLLARLFMCQSEVFQEEASDLHCQMTGGVRQKRWRRRQGTCYVLGMGEHLRRCN